VGLQRNRKASLNIMEYSYVEKAEPEIGNVSEPPQEKCSPIGEPMIPVMESFYQRLAVLEGLVGQQQRVALE
jgi:hypothetical protein